MWENKPVDTGIMSLVDIVSANLADASDNIKTAPIKLEKAELSYSGKPVSLSTVSNQKTRRIRKDVQDIADRGILPAGPSNIVIEWGDPKGLRSLFAEVTHDGNVNFLHVRDTIIGDNADNEQTERKRVFVTGTCLFGKYGVSGKTEKGKTLNLCDPYQMRNATPEKYGKIQELDVMRGLHGYELQSTISRQGIFDLVGADVIYFNAPLSPYVLYAREAIRKGVMDEEIFSEWVKKLTQRVDDVIDYEQGTAGCEVKIVDPLCKYFDLLTDVNLELEEIVDRIKKDDPWWGAYFKNSPPETFSDLGYGSYTKVYYDLLDGRDDIELIAVEDQIDTRILFELQSCLKKEVLPQPQGNNRFVGLYPFIQVMAPDEKGHADFAFMSDLYGRRELSEKIFAAANGSIPEAVIERARNCYAHLKQEQMHREYKEMMQPGAIHTNPEDFKKLLSETLPLLRANCYAR